MMAKTLDSTQDELTTLAELGMKKALSAGAEEAETFVSWMDTISINIKKNIIEARRGSPAGVGVRVVWNGKVGFAAQSGTDKAGIERVVEEALAVAKIRPPDPDFEQLPDPISRPSKDGIIHDAILEFSEKDALEAVNNLAQTAFAQDKRIRSLFGAVEVHKGVQAVA
ncbi:hypothetical protein GWN63_03220, partial [Candidatus Bathyarchaeota archaeon]|nr:hypothetical protein [Candidatus Bathyarchaeota archaeon]NIR17552.1 hypothetical protein [Desulfobacterales bacterium]NIU81240.1 hypothetical protein [Candidatus Bathyarchaeota archaeon]NIV67890.1 hypothetical protein [Candidatus Bathyarchaeota archaeon]NIW16334.1 hypothetical protein [Candidatus Bathyarchaeota archaeon]